MAGAVFSFREGVAELLHPVPLHSFTVIYVVLGMSVLLDATSLIQSAVELRREARVQSRDFLDHLTLTSDPTVRAVAARSVRLRAPSGHRSDRRPLTLAVIL